MPSSDPALSAAALPRLSEVERHELHAVARASIRHGLEHGEPLLPDPAGATPVLQELGASFVTLRRHGRLRGCTGTLEAVRPRIVDVARNAFASAFRDPRFPPLETQELADLEIHVSLLSRAERLAVRSREELLGCLRPGRDGLIVEGHGRRATFLPAVWSELPQPESFVDALLRKAGLEAEPVSPALRFSRYATLSVDAPSERSGEEATR